MTLQAGRAPAGFVSAAASDLGEAAAPCATSLAPLGPLEPAAASWRAISGGLRPTRPNSSTNSPEPTAGRMSPPGKAADPEGRDVPPGLEELGDTPSTSAAAAPQPVLNSGTATPTMISCRPDRRRWLHQTMEQDTSRLQAVALEFSTAGEKQDRYCFEFSLIKKVCVTYLNAYLSQVRSTESSKLLHSLLQLHIMDKFVQVAERRCPPSRCATPCSGDPTTHL